MSNKINDKLGLKAAGKRRMMALPNDRAAAVRITSAVCPSCGRRGATASRITPGALFCTYCVHTWQPACD